MEDSNVDDAAPSDGDLRVRDLNNPRESPKYFEKLLDNMINKMMEELLTPWGAETTFKI